MLSPAKNPKYSRPGSHRGFALVLVLMLVVLMAVLIVAIFSSIRTESKATFANSSGQLARQFSDLALQAAKSQIQKATTQGASFAWASQPGMIRCYDSQGTEKKWFKLYSAASMTETPTAGNFPNQIKEDLPTQAWSTPEAPNYGVFTDLNSPIIASDGSSLIYPIVNPTGAKSLASSGSETIAGFDVDTSQIPGYVSGSASAGNNPVAMPVRWLYVLEDGTLVPGETGSKAGEVKVPGAGKGNPILGRIAFWTDDETCKLNINTAADGTYFDSPRFDSKWPIKGPSAERQRMADRQFAITPPVAREYQRFIGHPAQTRLSTVLPTIAALDSLNRSKAMTTLTPYLQWGGSEGGTKTLWDLAGLTNPYLLQDPNRTAPYVSLDEWMFTTSMNSSLRVQNKMPNGNALLNNQQLERLHFFLTATSEAPEVNLFGKPRVAMWPVHNDLLANPASDRTTALDRMIADVSSLKSNSGSQLGTANTYFFTRKSSTSPTIDYTDILRNQKLFGYLRKLSQTNIPGYGSNYATKYTQSGIDQILTEIFDYIRSTNASDPMLMDSDIAKDRTYATFRPELKANTFVPTPMYQDMGRGQVTPIYLADYGTKGFGRFYTISEVAINLGWDSNVAGSTDKIKITPALYLGLFSPSLGPPNLEPNFRIQIETADMQSLQFTPAGGTPVNPFGPPGELYPSRTVYSTMPKANRWHGGDWYPFWWGGAVGPRLLPVAKESSGNNAYSFHGKSFEVKTSDKINFSGGTLHIKIFWADQVFEGIPGKAEYLVQELTVELPAYTNLDVPTKPSAGIRYDSRLNNFCYGSGNSEDYNPVLAGDTIRSAVSKYNGDMRLIAAQRTVPKEAFTKHPNFDDNTKSVHSFRDPFPASNFKVNSGFQKTGQLVKDAIYSANFQPVTGLVEDAAQPDATGDWDNGLSIFPDGPYINKPDEVGVQYYTYDYANPSNYTYYMQGNYDSITTAKGYSSPNRTVASPVMFGSLSTGVPIGTTAAVPWRTLLFRPQQNHFGFTSKPKDSLILDWFWMPVVEPYAISTHLATAGKVNLNYQIAPFNYIKRATALIGTLSSEYVIAVPTADAGKYKNRTATGTDIIYRFPVKATESDGITAGESTGTLRQFKERFNGGEIFRSASDICNIYLVPDKVPGTTITAQSWTSDAQAEAFWALNKLTGDNSRERPYNGLYSRLTTKSNTYTVYIRAQALKGPMGGPSDVWVEKPERISAEYRGSATINRYLNPEDNNIPDFADAANFNKTLDSYYKYRVLESRRFLP